MAAPLVPPERDTGTITRTDLALALDEAGPCAVRLAAERLDDEAYALALEVTTWPEPPWFAPATWDYGTIVFTAQFADGAEVARWVRSGAVAVSEPMTGFSLNCALRELQDSGTAERLPSGATHDRPTLEWPYSRLVFRSGERTSFPTHRPSFVVAPQAPAFPSIEAAWTAFFHGERVLAASLPWGDLLTVRLQRPRARIKKISLTNERVVVSIERGEDGRDEPLFVSFSDARPVPLRGGQTEASFHLEDGPPREWWAVVARNFEWLDYRVVSSATHLPAGVEVSVDSADELATYLLTGETENIEFKQRLGTTRDEAHRALHTVAAFANGVGGVLLFGVDDEGIVVGIEEDFRRFADRLTQLVSDVATPRPAVTLRRYDRAEGLVVGLVVASGDSPPYGIGTKNTRYYVRRNGTTVPALQEEVRRLARQRPPQTRLGRWV